MPEAKPVVTADPNVFFACVFAGLSTSHFPPDSWLGLAKNQWHNHRKAVEWVASGQAERDYDAAEKQRISAEKTAVERAAREAVEEEAYRTRQTELHGSKAK